ncbi:proton-conducting transporter membrane subunit [Ruminiclostridium sufflavum]|uniref:proton-conducting transporter transmembrane domain-containing protein n=1 Tax=Ruminiclostridium sufflavum TaxID=396504 RepID=UPI003BF47930
MLFAEKISLSPNFTNNIPFFSLSFNIDNLSAFFILIISIVTFVVSLFSYTYMSHYFFKRNISIFGFLYNLFVLSMILLVSSSNLLLFLFFWELMSLISYFLVNYENEKKEVQKASRIYIIMTYAGTAFITAAFGLIAYCTKSFSFEFSAISNSSIPTGYANLIYVFLLIGFGTKAGLIPMHVWLPYAHPVAPGNISALMSGVMIKMSVYGILRAVLDFLPENPMWWGTLTLIAGVVSAVFGVVYSVASTINIKRLLAYSSIENMGLIFSGIGMLLIARTTDNSFLIALAMTAVLLHTINHAVFKSLLFMGAGAIQYSAHTKNMEKLGGLIKKMPVASLFIFIGCLTISAVPPFSGFISEYIIFQTVINSIIWFSSNSPLIILFITAAAALSMTGALVAFCFVKMYGISFLGMPRSVEAESVKEPGKPMLIALGISSFLCVALGVFSKYVIGLIDNISNELMNLRLLSTDWSLTKFAHYPVNNGKLDISIGLLSAFIVLLSGIILLLVMFIRKHTNVERYNTWDCGYTRLNPKIQYSATGFSKSIRIILRGIFKPNRNLTVTEGYAPYNIKKGTYTMSTEKVIEKYLYAPFIKFIISFSKKFRYKIQTGSIHIYLLYFFTILILMLLYYSFMG